MSAEAPKEAGTTAPVTPQKPEGVFSRFFGRLFAELSESQPTQQPVSRVVQPPPGLEDFAAKIQQGIEVHLSAQRQQELDRKNAEAAKIAAEVEKQANAAQRQRELEDQERITREEAITEAAKVLKDFRIAERLEYIRDTVWEGKGKINPVESKFGIKIGEKRGDILGGFELVFRYPSVSYYVSNFDSEHNCSVSHPWQGLGVPEARISESTTNLKINVLNLYEVSEQEEKVLILEGYNFFHQTIHLGTIDSEPALEAALIQESVNRSRGGGLPSVYERTGMARLPGS